jgi:hypothetical protein
LATFGSAEHAPTLRRNRMAFQVESFDPTSGPQGTPVTIHVTDAPAGMSVTTTSVYLGDLQPIVNAVTIANDGSGDVDVDIPDDGESNDFKVRVYVSGQSYLATSNEEFSVEGAPGEPFVRNMQAPSTGVHVMKESVTLLGNELDQVKMVRIGPNKQQTVLQHSGPNRLTFKVPGPAPEQDTLVRVTAYTENQENVRVPGQLKILAG